jgi:hypothetical protein
MLSRNSRHRIVFVCVCATFALLLALIPRPIRAQDDSSKHEGRHGRKYKAPPQTSVIEVTVVKGFNKKPITGAAVIFHPVDADGKDEGFLEMKTDPEGKAKIDVIPTGSSLRVQVIATGFATYAEDYKINQPQQEITVSMLRPRAQVSTYVDETGKPSLAKPGVQEPVRPKLSPNGVPVPQSAAKSSGAATNGAGSPQNSPANSGSKQ